MVARTVGDRCTLGQVQFTGHVGLHPSLLGKGGPDISYQRVVEAVVVHQEIGHATATEVPKHAFGQAGDGGTHLARQAHGYIVAGEHHLIYLFIHLRLVLLDPCQLGGGEVARRVEQMRQASFLSQSFESPLSVGHSARVAPDDGRP